MTGNLRTEYVSVPGGYISLNSFGQNDAATPILFIHGGPGGNFDSFVPMAEMLSKDRMVYMYNQLGSDETNSTGEESLWTPERYIEALNDLIASFNIKKIHVIAHSWGAMLAVEHLLRTPDSPVISLTMVSPYLNTSLWISDAKARLAELSGDYLKIVEECESDIKFDGQIYQDIIREYNKNFQCRDLQSHQRQYRQLALKSKTPSGLKVYKHMWGPSEFTCTGILKDMDITGKLPQIKIRVLIICGVYDQVRKETCEYFRSLIPGSVRVTIPEASQTSFLENPNLFYDTMNNFLEHF